MMKWQSTTLSILLILALCGAVGPVGPGRAVSDPPSRPPTMPATPTGPRRVQPEIPTTSAGNHGAHRSAFGPALVGSIPVGHGPSAVAVDTGTDTIYVANGNNANGGNAGGDTVTVIDGRRCQARNASRCAGPWPTIAVGDLPSALTVDQATHTLYVAHGGSNTVSVVDTASCNARLRTGCGQIPGSVRVGGSGVGIYADSAHQTVYVPVFADSSGSTVSMIDTRHCRGGDLSGCASQHPPSVGVGTGPGDVDVNQATHTAYVVNLTGVSVFDAQTCNAHTTTGCGIVGTLTVCSGECFGPFQAKVDPRTNSVYTANGDATVSVFDGTHCQADDLTGCAAQLPGTVTASSPAFFEHVIALAIDADAHTVYVTSQKDDNLAVIDTATCNGSHRTACASLAPPTVHTGSNAQGLAIDSSTHTVYVAAEVDDAISVVDETRCSAGHTSGCRHPAPAMSITDPGVPATDRVSHTLFAPSRSGVTLVDIHRCNAFDPRGCSTSHLVAAAAASPFKAVVDAGRRTVYVAETSSPNAGSVSVLRAATCNSETASGCKRPGAALAVTSGRPTDLVEDPLSGTLYVATIPASGPPVVSVFDGKTCNAATVTGCGQRPSLITLPAPSTGTGVGLAVDAATRTLYATVLDASVAPAHYLGSSVYVIDTAGCNSELRSGCGRRPTIVPNVGDNPVGIAVDPRTHAVYTANLANGEAAGSVSVLDGATCNGSVATGCRRTPRVVRTGFGSVDVAVDPASGSVYTANVEDASVSVVGRRTCSVDRTGCRRAARTIDVALAPDHVVLASWICTGYVVSGAAGAISVIRLRGRGCR